MQGESALEIETLAQFCVVYRIKQVKACKKYLLLSTERSIAMFWKYICAMETKESAKSSFFKKGSRFSSVL
jgi:hypothetical protein